MTTTQNIRFIGTAHVKKLSEADCATIVGAPVQGLPEDGNGIVVRQGESVTVPKALADALLANEREKTKWEIVSDAPEETEESSETTATTDDTEAKETGSARPRGRK